MNCFVIFSGRWFRVGLNFESEEQKDSIIESIRTVWEYYPKDFRILFSGVGQITYHDDKDDFLTKTLDLAKFIEYIQTIIELKTEVMPVNEKSKDIYEQMIKTHPLQKFLFRQQIEKVNEQLNLEKQFIQDLKDLTIKLRSIL